MAEQPQDNPIGTETGEDGRQCKEFRLIAWELEKDCMVRRTDNMKTLVVKEKGKGNFYRLVENEEEGKNAKEKTSGADKPEAEQNENYRFLK